MSSSTLRIVHFGSQRALDYPPRPGWDTDLQRLGEALRHYPALNISGPRGIGKSTLAAMLLGSYSNGGPADFGMLIWYGLRGDECFAEVSARVLSAVTGETRIPATYGQLPENAQAEQTLEALRAHPALLILDNMQQRLLTWHGDTGGTGFAMFLRGAAQNLGESRLLLTAPEGEDGLKGAGPERFGMPGLRHEVGARRLADWGIERRGDGDDALLQRASERCGGHPGALRMLYLLVARGGNRGVKGWVVDPRLWGGSKEEIAQRLFERAGR